MESQRLRMQGVGLDHGFCKWEDEKDGGLHEAE